MNTEELEQLIAVSAQRQHTGRPAFTSRDAILSFYWNAHPRFVFFKTAPRHAKLLDIGAGDGGLVFWKGWNFPDRHDIELHVNDLSKGAHFDRCDRSIVCDLSTTIIEDGEGTYDAVMASHVLEHVREWNVFIGRLKSLLLPGGLLYLELPTPESIEFPSRQFFLDQGIPTSTVNFHDDATHLETAPIETVKTMLQTAGFTVQVSGCLKNRFLGEELLRWGRTLEDSELCTYGIWLYSGFSQYLVACKSTKEKP